MSAGQNGNLWVAQRNGSLIWSVAIIGKLTPQGSFTEYAIPGASLNPVGIIVGPDNNLWFVGGGTNKLGRIYDAGNAGRANAGSKRKYLGYRKCK
jgi:streptogramin lyase